MRLRILLFCLAMATGVIAPAQSVQIRGRFLTDSVRIGEPVTYGVSVKYPEKLPIFLPDSLFPFKGFSYFNRSFTPTVNKDGINTDSAVYELVSFSIDSIQYFSLPAFVVNGVDTLFYNPETDSVFLRQYVDIRTDTVAAAELPVKSDTTYAKVIEWFDYPFYITASVIAAVLLAILWIIFGKRIIRTIRQRRLNRRLQDFLNRFGAYIQEMQSEYRPQIARQAVHLWKGYLEQLEGLPYRSLTSREISGLAEHGELELPLKGIDRLIYGGSQPENLEAFHRLKSFSEDRSFRMMERIKQGQA